MKNTILGYIKYISKRNLIYPLCILGVVILVILILPIRQVIFPRNVYYAEAVLEAANDRCEYINVRASDLIYTGYDFYINGKAKASYYYSFNKASDSDIICLFFLIPTNSDITRRTLIQSYNANAKIITENPGFDTFLHEFSEDINWPSEALKKSCGSILISSFNYHFSLYLILAILVCLTALACLIYIIFNLAIIINPSLHEAARRLDRFGLDSEDFTAIDDELAHNCILNSGSLYVTYHYLIAFEKHTLCVIPLYNIIWAYRVSRWDRRMNVQKSNCDLIVVTSPKDKVLIRGSKKRDVDKILKFLSEDFSRIEIGYSEDTKERIESLL